MYNFFLFGINPIAQEKENDTTPHIFIPYSFPMHYTSREVYEFIAHEANDPIVERKTCLTSGSQFPIPQSDIFFYQKISASFPGKPGSTAGNGRMGLLPTRCPEERERRRILFKSNGKLYRRTCDKTGVSLVSIYHAKTEFPVYSITERRSDNRDPMTYGQTVARDTPFFDQFFALRKNVPKIALMNDNGLTSENCEYCQDFSYGKNCYLVNSSRKCEDCCYGFHILEGCKDVYDSEEMIYAENCYACCDSEKCTHCLYCIQCFDCSTCTQCTTCIGCSHCIGCANLTNKTYCVNNTQYTKEAFATIDKSAYLSFPSPPPFQKNMANPQGLNCWGNNNFNAKNAFFCFDNKGCEDCKYVIGGCTNTMSFDTSMTGSPTRCYECITCDDGFNVLFSSFCRKCSFVFYSDFCHNCQYCFCCAGLRNKQYCILNTQYTKEAYEELLPHIIKKMEADGERGEFFDSRFSPFAYNETFAQEYYPYTKEEACAAGYKRRDEEEVVSKTTPTTTSDDVLQKTFVCEISGRPFKIMKQELAFYRKHNLPLPTKHPTIRHEERLRQRSPRRLDLGACSSCGKKIVHTPAAVSQDIYCEVCYTNFFK